MTAFEYFQKWASKEDKQIVSTNGRLGLMCKFAEDYHKEKIEQLNKEK